MWNNVNPRVSDFILNLGTFENGNGSKFTQIL